MKKILYLIATLITAMSVSSCNSNQEKWTPGPSEIDNLTFTKVATSNYLGDENATKTGLVKITLISGIDDNVSEGSPNSTALYLDCFTELAEDPENAILPTGTYGVGSLSEGMVNTFAGYTGERTGTYVEVFDENGTGQIIGITDGQLKVTHNEEAGTYLMEGSFMDLNGISVKWKYSGPLQFNNYNKLLTDPDGFFILREYDETYRYEHYEGDVDETGTAKISLQFLSMMTGEGIKAQLYTILTESGKELSIQEGVYTIGDGGEEFTAAKGQKLPNNGGTIGTCELLEDSFGPATTKLATSGTITVKRTVNGNYDIKFDLEGEDVKTGYSEPLKKLRYIGPLNLDDYSPTLIKEDIKSAKILKVEAGYWGQQDDAPASTGAYTLYLSTTDHNFADSRHIYLELYGDVSADPDNAAIPTNTYPVKGDKTKPSAYQGYYSDGKLQGTGFVTYAINGVEDSAAAIAGSVKVTHKSNGDYEIQGEISGKSNSVKNRSYQVTFTYTGPIEIDNRITP